jgi:hypothetical protein
MYATESPKYGLLDFLFRSFQSLLLEYEEEFLHEHFCLRIVYGFLCKFIYELALFIYFKK